MIYNLNSLFNFLKANYTDLTDKNYVNKYNAKTRGMAFAAEKSELIHFNRGRKQ
jgi:hypothetical protein